MVVVTDRRYEFSLAPDELWSALVQPDQFQRWWPWLRRFDGATLAPAERWACSVQPPLSYPVRFTIEIDHIDAPKAASAVIDGDVVGTAELTVTPTDGGSEARLLARLAPGNGFLRIASRFARPVVRLGHDWVLDEAARQFRAKALPP